MGTKKDERAVSPIVSVLLLLSITLGLAAILSQIAFTSVDSPDTTSADLEISHTDSGSSDSVSVSVRLIRNKNFESFSYIIENQNGSQKSEGQLNNIGTPGDSQNLSLEVQDKLVVLGESGSKREVITTYYVPE